MLLPRHFVIDEISSVHTRKTFKFSTLGWPGDCDSVRQAMLKIQRKTNGDVVFTLSGRLEADNVSELSALLAAEPARRAVVLDLKDVVLVDRTLSGSCGHRKRRRHASQLSAVYPGLDRGRTRAAVMFWCDTQAVIARLRHVYDAHIQQTI